MAADRSKPLAACTRCGAMAPGGTEGCWELSREILALEYSDLATGAVNPLTVDAHTLQHAEDHSTKKNAFHLLRPCWLLEHGGGPRTGQGLHRLQAHVDG